jgi:hypothetical protein
VIAQRFAIDFVRFRGLSTFAGDPSRNESYFLFGAPVLAVAPGRVIATRAGVPENIPPDRAAVHHLQSTARQLHRRGARPPPVRPLRPPAHRQRPRPRGGPGTPRPGPRPGREHRELDRAAPALPRDQRPLAARLRRRPLRVPPLPLRRAAGRPGHREPGHRAGRPAPHPRTAVAADNDIIAFPPR